MTLQHPLHGLVDHVDMAIVGAGLSGLTAAQKLLDAGKTVAVIEARDRIGGRIWTHNLKNGGVTELGAAFVGPTQDRVLSLMEELRIESFNEYNEGSYLAFFEDQRLEYPSAAPLPPLDDATMEQIIEVMERIDELVAGINVKEPWESPSASRYDSITLQDWAYDIVTTNTGRQVFEVAVASIWSVTSKQLSLLYALSYVAGAGNETTPGTFERLIFTSGGGQESRIAGGAGLIPERLADKIGRDKIRLSTPIESITRQECGFHLLQAKDKSFLARKVIVAMSPPVAARITYSPPLAPERQELMKRMFMGNEGKMNAIYKKPFWRELGLSGEALSATGTVRATFDASPADASYGAILGFIGAEQMKELDNATEAEIQTLVKRDYVRYFGPQAADAEEWVLVRWDNEEYSLGGPTALAGPNMLTRLGAALRKPCGGIHWAGTETSDYWIGYMDGAIRSGERVAREILEGQ